MRKNFRLKLIVSSLIILLPCVVGLIFWDSVPQLMVNHWGLDAQADGLGSRGMMVFALPFILLLSHWFCLFFTLKLDPKNKNSDSKALGLMIWIIPLVSLFSSAIVYSTAFGREMNMSVLTAGLFGLLFIVIGNYLPKCRQNYTMGIKLPWTLNNEENWNATHRFGGKIWVIGGILMLLGAFLPENMVIWALLVEVLVLALVPSVYSWLYYKKQLAAGTATKEDASFIPRGVSKKASYLSIIFVVLILIFCSVIMFTGDIEISFSKDIFTIKADYYRDLSVEYLAVDSIEFVSEDSAGTRVNGFASGRLLMGFFNNSLYGNYTRYSYTSCPCAVKLDCGGNTLVVSGKDAEATMEIYNELKSKIG